MSPFLGNALFPLLPWTMQGPPLIPVTTFLMGVIAVIVQFYAGETIRRTAVRKRFRLAGICLLASLALLWASSQVFVVRKTGEAGKPLPGILVGAWQPKACDGMTQEACLPSANPEAIETRWGTSAMLVSKSALSLFYIGVMGSFGALIGLLLLQEEARRQERSRNRQARSAPRKKRTRAPAKPPAGASLEVPVDVHEQVDGPRGG